AQGRTAEPPGSIAGIIRDGQGQPVAGAEALVASPLGDVYSAESGPDGLYVLADVPPGRYVPVAGRRGYGDALPRTCLAGLCWKDAVAVRPGSQAPGPDLELKPLNPLEIAVNDSLVVSATTEVESTAPLPGRARRTNFSFERAGLRVNDCWLYEPVTEEQGEGSLPTLLLILPGPVLGWEIIPVPFAAQGFSVLACYPLRGIDIDGDAADLLTALEYVRQGRVPSAADTGRLGLIAASFTSLHAYRLLALTDQVDVALLLGGMSDGFAFRHDIEAGTAHAREPFDMIIIGLGLPNSSPELYYKYSAMYHLEGLPPLCLLHGIDDELVPFNQSVLLADELERRGMPHEFYSYEGLQHYFSTKADDATTQQMFRDSLDCLRRGLESK
ncbi:MAG: hypothetical protein EHM56_10330, partial [Chloroflexi bacterium]